MYIKTENLTTIKQEYSEISYLYNKETKVILPIEFPLTPAKYPESHDTMLRIFKTLGIRVKNLKVYLEKSQNFYTYLGLCRFGQIYDININFCDAIKIADSAKIPIYVNDKIVREHGIKVTKELVASSLDT